MMMLFEKFKKKVKYIPKDLAGSIRNNYIEKFIDTKCEWYEKYIRTLSEYIDGTCYSGYLWECLPLPYTTFIKFEEIISYRNKFKKVLIMWDIHSKEKIWVDDYWKFGKDSIVKVDYDDLLDNLEYFPEDVYIFDESMKWSLILTHEDNDGIRVCAKIGDI